jgi:RND family efflux transporter MFP subunit
MRLPALALFMGLTTLPAALWAADQPAGFLVQPQQVTDWKPVFGTIEARDRLPARARLGGTLTALSVVAGDEVTAGQELGRVVDPKLDSQLTALSAGIAAVQAQLSNAETELARATDLAARGATTTQKLETAQTQVTVLRAQITAQEAERQVILQQQAEGAVLAPIAGRVLSVPQAMGGVVMAGETVAELGGGGFYLRLSLPERLSAGLQLGDAITVELADGATKGTLARIYPLIESGRVQADVELSGLDADFVGARVLVQMPLAERAALMVPADYLTLREGLDFVTVTEGGTQSARLVVPGGPRLVDGVPMVEIISGLAAGETLVPHE